MSGLPPPIPVGLQIYDSYLVDPKWQTRFTIMWTSLTGAAIIFSLPHLFRAIMAGRAFTGLLGISEDWSRKRYRPIVEKKQYQTIPYPKKNKRLAGALSAAGSVLFWSPPGIGLNAGQLFVIAGYLVIVLICITVEAPLIENPNRAGFLALAQLPPVFLFATKNSVLSLLLGPGNGYEKLNFIHRWSSRGLFLGAVVHGSLWINNHIVWDLPILGPQKETSGVAALALLCIIVLASLKPVRKWGWQFFFIIHTLSFVAFFVTICYHTIYAIPWIFPPLALYGFDLLMRMFRFRIKDATLFPVDDQMTLIRIPYSDAGWTAGQHVRLRVFFSGRVFESHPLTILSAPPATSCLSIRNSGSILLGARVKGDWTRALNEYARANASLSSVPTFSLAGKEKQPKLDLECPVQVMIDGPYGGCGLDLGEYERVLLIAGGSGATFAIGMLDDIVGRCVRRGRERGERTRRIEFAWCVRSFGSIAWFAPQLMEIAHTAALAGAALDVHISVFVTCLCNPDAVPPIPNSRVEINRPSAHTLLERLVVPEGVDIDPETGDVVSDGSAEARWVGLGGGVGVCASGPESMTREAANAVASMGMARGVELGGIALHTELFAL